MMVKTLRKAGL